MDRRAHCVTAGNGSPATIGSLTMCAVHRDEQRLLDGTFAAPDQPACATVHVGRSHVASNITRPVVDEIWTKNVRSQFDRS